MVKPDIPENEELRLGNLRSLSILDTAPEEQFDRLTRLAKRVFDVPIALVSLVDENRQWFKSCIGLDVSETSRELVAVQLATQDELTGILNRREFIMLAQNSLNLCKRNKITASLIFFDLNKFKQINDNFGHLEGDRALKAVAEQMRETFRDSDLLARLGGDEFVVLLPGSSLQYAREITLRFRSMLEDYNRLANRGYEISFSEGIVQIEHDQNNSLESLISRADSLMYDNKSA